MAFRGNFSRMMPFFLEMRWGREGRSPRQSHCSKQAVLIGWVLVSPASAIGRLYQLRLPWQDMAFAWQQNFMTITKPASVETVSGYECMHGTLWHRHHETATQMRPCQPLAAAPTCSYTNCTYPAHTHGLDAHSACVVSLLHIHTKTHNIPQAGPISRAKTRPLNTPAFASRQYHACRFSGLCYKSSISTRCLSITMIK